jgi:DNA topoisomerase IA
MERNKVGRPSTYAKALERLHDKQLVQFPHGQGPLRLTPAGVATAVTIELAAEALSDPAFSARLTKLLEEIETGTTGPRAVLCDLMPLIAPGHDPAEVGPRIWNTLSELEQAIDSADLPLPAGSLVTAP